MAFPDDILLPANAKKFGFVDTRYPYNVHWDINWSFAFALTGTEHGFSTFLTTNPNVLSAEGGQYLGVLPTTYIYPYILSENDETILDETNQPVLYDDIGLFGSLLTIAFDTTGRFALSAGGNPGVGIDNIKANSLIIRNDTNDIILYEHLSSLSTDFFLTSSIPVYQTLRFRIANSGKKLSIDYKKETNEFVLLTSIPITIPVEAMNIVTYPGFTFCSPVSSLSTPSTLFFKNFHTQGNTSPPTYDIRPFTPLSASILNNYTSISGVSAYPSYE